jgi:hypothetical protein
MARREDVLKELTDRVAKLEHEVELAEAARECRNIGNMYQTFHGKQTTSETHLYALKTPDSRVEMLWGIYDGPNSIIKWKTLEGYGAAPKKIVNLPSSPHAQCTPIIEVAKDGRTAKGLWLMFAYYPGQWAASQLAVDFIKEDNAWKIWHYTTVGLIFSPFEKGWHRENSGVIERMQEMNKARPPELQTDRPPSYPWMWGADEYFQNIPPVPESYEVWDESLACIPGPGREHDIKEFE